MLPLHVSLLLLPCRDSLTLEKNRFQFLSCSSNRSRISLSSYLTVPFPFLLKNYQSEYRSNFWINFFLEFCGKGNLNLLLIRINFLYIYIYSLLQRKGIFDGFFHQYYIINYINIWWKNFSHLKKFTRNNWFFKFFQVSDTRWKHINFTRVPFHPESHLKYTARVKTIFYLYKNVTRNITIIIIENVFIHIYINYINSLINIANFVFSKIRLFRVIKKKEILDKYDSFFFDFFLINIYHRLFGIQKMKIRNTFSEEDSVSNLDFVLFRSAKRRKTTFN